MKKIFGILSLFIAYHAQAQQHWSYSGEASPEHWGELEGASDCSNSKNQSPIDIITLNLKKDSKLEKIKFNYDADDIKDVLDNGHSLQFDFKEGGFVKYAGKKYGLLQFHAHEESEHTVDGMRYPLELHFVHKSDDGSILVISTLVKEGKENSYFEHLKVFKSLGKGKKEDTDILFNPQNMYPKNKSYYTYLGSLTTPPCTDHVTWIIFKNPIEMTKDEIVEISKHLPKNNNRPIQELHGRQVSLSSK